MKNTKVDISQLPKGAPYEMVQHIRKFNHSDLNILQNKKDKIRGIYCNTCKRFITSIVLVRK